MEPSLAQLKQDLCAIGQRTWQRGLVAANDGNFSVRLTARQMAEARVSGEAFLSTPTLVSKGFMSPEDMVILDGEGRKLAGDKDPTSEIRLHLYLYRHRPDAVAVVHAHPPHAQAFCIARRGLPTCVLPEVEVFLGEIPMATYATPGTWTFAETLAPHVNDHDVFLLASHGAVAIGRDPYEAYHRLESLDHYCRVLLLAMPLGGWSALTEAQTAELLAIRQRLGMRTPQLSRPQSTWCRPTSPKVEDGPTGRDAIRAMVADAVRRIEKS